MDKMLKLPIWTTRIAAILLVLFVSMLTFLVWFEPPWLTYKNSPFPVLNSPVKLGGVVKLEVSRCSTAAVTRVYGLSRRLECGDLMVPNNPPISLPAGVTSIEPGCGIIQSTANVIPVNAPIGWCRIRGFGETQGVVKTHSIEWETKWFEVIP